MKRNRFVWVSLLVGLVAAPACVEQVSDEVEPVSEDVGVESQALFTGIRVRGAVLGLQHNENQTSSGTVMYSAFQSEATHRDGGDRGAALHRGFEWWSLPDTGPNVTVSLPPGIVVALRHSANQAGASDITAFGRSPLVSGDFSGFKRMAGGDLGAGSGVGYYWFESTGAGFTNWSGVDAMLPKYTVVGLKHAINQKSKVLVWNGVTYDPAKSAVAPPGFRRMIGGDRRDGGNEGYYWFEKITGEEIVSLPTLTTTLPQSLRMAVGSNAAVVDRDNDCLVDSMEAMLAATFRPQVAFDDDEVSLLQNEPVTVYRIYPTSATTVHIRYLFLFKDDGGYGPENTLCADDEHPGDNDHADYDLQTSDGGRTWRVFKIGLGNGPKTWPTNTRLEVFDKTHPKFYFSGSKHHEYFNRDNDERGSFFSKHGCEDDVNGAGDRVFVDDASFEGFASNNVGEPNANTGFVNDLYPFFPGHGVWSDKCFVESHPIIGDDACVSNRAKLDERDPVMPPAIGLCSTPTTGSAFLWGGSSLDGTFPASSSYSYNSTNQPNTITKTGTGRYRVDFPGLGLDYGGNVQVTAYGSGAERCKVDYWYPSGGAVTAYIACFNAAGAPADSRFNASFIKRGAATPWAPGGYLWADQPYADHYFPDPTYSWNSTGAQNEIWRYGVGQYSASFPGVNVNGGTVEVTAYGYGNAHCKVGGWGSGGVSVNCFSPSGAPVDSTFTLNFAEKASHDTPSYAYAWAEQPQNASYPPDSYYQRNFRSCAAAPAITMKRTATGRYTATIPYLGPYGATVHVTGYGYSPNACKVVSWGMDTSNGSQVNVACHNPSGQLVDDLFVLVFANLDATIC